MRTKATERITARVFPGTTDRLWLFRDQLAAAYPDQVVTMADVFNFCVNSGSTLLNEGRRPATGAAPKDRERP